MISVIVPVFNGEKTILTCLKSLRKQTTPREQYEIVVVDDGSSDKTGELVKRFADVQYFYRKNIGPAGARNFGVERSAGDILLFIDSDCEAAEDWIEKMTVPFFEQSVTAVKGVYKTKQAGLVPRLVQVEFEERYRKMARSKGLDFMDFSAGAIRKKVFIELGGFEEDLKMSEDVQFAYKLTNAGHKIVFINSGVVYHQHPASFRSYLKAKFWRSYWRMDVYKNYPKKIFRDSYTPQTLKLQILSIFLTLFSLVLWPLMPFMKYVLLVECGLVLLLLLPLTARAFRCGLMEGIRMPIFVIGRAVALGFGVMYYFLEIRNFRELVSFVMLAVVVIVPSFFTGGMDVIARTLVFVLAFPILFFILRADKRQLRGAIPWRFNVLPPLFAFFIILLVSVFFSVSPYDSYTSLLHWLSYLILFFGAFYLVGSFSEGHKFAYLIIVLAVLLSIIGIYFFVLTEFYSYLRVISTFYQHNPFAGFLLFALTLSFSYLFFENRKRTKVLLLLITAFLSLTFIMTHSRGAWVSLALPLLVIIIVSLGQRKRWLFTSLVVVLLTVFTAGGWWGLTQLKEYQAAKVATSGQTAIQVSYSVETPEENAVTARLHFWRGAWGIFLDHPVFGTGWDTFKITYRQYLQDIRYYSIDPHNVYLKVLAELGVIGALPFFWLVGVIILTVMATLRQLHKLDSDSERALMLGLGTGLVGALLHNGVELDWQFPTNVVVFFIVLAVFFKLFAVWRVRTVPQAAETAVCLADRKPFRAVMPLLAFLVMLGGLMLFLSDNFMGRAEADISDLKFSLAETNLRSAATFDPLNYNLHYNLAWAYYYLIPENIEKYRQSYVSELERTINLSPEDYRGYEDLGKYYLLSKDYPKSEEYLKKAVALNPVGKPELYLRLASAYYLQDKKAEARDLLDQAAGNYQTSLKSSVIWVVQNKEKILSDISQIHTDLGILYQQAGDKSRAKSEYLLALDYYAENKTAQKYLEEPGIE